MESPVTVWRSAGGVRLVQGTFELEHRLPGQFLFTEELEDAARGLGLGVRSELDRGVGPRHVEDGPGANRGRRIDVERLVHRAHCERVLTLGEDLDLLQRVAALERSAVHGALEVEFQIMRLVVATGELEGC